LAAAALPAVMASLQPKIRRDTKTAITREERRDRRERERFFIVVMASQG
jgi:hypothetical protein